MTVMPVVRTADWRPRAGAHWERWSLNGEVIITGLVPALPGGARLAHCLTWVLREFASHCRRTYDGTGVLAFTCVGPRTPSTLAWALSLWFDLALHDPGLVRERARSRGGDPDACRWPALWLEGATCEYILPGARLPRGRAPRQKLLVLADARQVSVAARSLDVSTRVTRAWSDGLDTVARADATALGRLLDDDEHGFLANALVLVHAQPAGRARPRPALEESDLRHESLVAELAPLAAARGLPVGWHALWRLPSGMEWCGPDGERWMRYPAVSFVVAVRPLRPTG